MKKQKNEQVIAENSQLTDKQIIAQNISFFRKKLNLSQVELAARLQYSNKNISKWERAETTPDIFTLKKLAAIFGTTVDTIINPITDDNKKAIKTKSVIPFKWKIYMIALICSIMFLISCIAFFILSSMATSPFTPSLVFLYVLPIIDICIFIFICCVKRKVDITTLSIFGWLCAICVHLSLLNYPKIYYIYVIALGFQVLVPFFANAVNSGKIIKLNKIIIKKIKNKED